MKVSGESTVHADVAQVYAALTDPAVLVRTIPGCQRLEQTGPDTYKATVLAGVAAIKGTFDGEVRLSDREEPHAFTLHASGAGAPGTVNAVANVRLAADATGATLVRYDADATIGGVIGGVGQRMLSSVARRTAGEFFSAVDRELTAVQPAGAVLEAGLEEANLPAPPASVETAPVGAGVGLAGVGVAGVGAAGTGTGAPARPGVWTAPGPDAVTLAARQRVRDLFVGAVFGAVVALIGVLIGAIVAGW